MRQALDWQLRPGSHPAAQTGASLAGLELTFHNEGQRAYFISEWAGLADTTVAQGSR